MWVTYHAAIWISWMIRYGWALFKCRAVPASPSPPIKLSRFLGETPEHHSAYFDTPRPKPLYAPPAYSPKPQTAVQKGAAFERECARALKAHGWDVRLKGKSGDRGCDIFATRNGMKIAVQCKNLASPAGSRAVQEVHTACVYYEAHKAVVICPLGFTRQARELASRVNVILSTSGHF
ncbi:restriction endonuclease [Gluconobacter oxydans]|uniref:Restriction endonuclease type IV Mrr domain-containing protein n=2 Tax=Gluconobacter oxydans TaxID=442 RepID=Q5FN72_GLUOX|nr:Hypothetical protein GOX2444 [Gluconobacter oxydans 621H]